MAATEVVPNQAQTEAITAHVLWITVGLSCEGDSVAMTSATPVHWATRAGERSSAVLVWHRPDARRRAGESGANSRRAVRVGGRGRAAGRVRAGPLQ